MNPVFWFLIMLALVVIWGAVCILFKPLGKTAKVITKTIKEQMEDEENE